jgi:hypothetical protein
MDVGLARLAFGPRFSKACVAGTHHCELRNLLRKWYLIWANDSAIWAILTIDILGLICPRTVIVTQTVRAGEPGKVGDETGGSR